MPQPLTDLERIAADHAPCSALLVAPPGHALGDRLRGALDLRQSDAESLLARPPDGQRLRLGLVVDTLESLPAARGEALLALLRDRLAETLYCLAAPAQWPTARMLALGLRPLGAYPPAAGGAVLYHFDLYDYKRTPDWLNPRHWAHPELWDKHRW